MGRARLCPKFEQPTTVGARVDFKKLHLTGDERVLDIGCGDGKVTAEIAECVPRGRVVGVDSSAEMVGLAQSRYPSWAVRNLRFQQADANRLPFEREFTHVFSNAALHWVLDHKPVLRGINSCLVPGGKVGCCKWAAKGMRPMSYA